MYLRDGFPASPGHTLIVPKREIATWFDATPDEQTAIRVGLRRLPSLCYLARQPGELPCVSF